MAHWNNENFHPSEFTTTQPTHTIWYIWIINCFHLFFSSSSFYLCTHFYLFADSDDSSVCFAIFSFRKKARRRERRIYFNVERLMSCSLYGRIWKSHFQKRRHQDALSENSVKISFRAVYIYPQCLSNYVTPIS